MARHQFIKPSKLLISLISPPGCLTSIGLGVADSRCSPSRALMYIRGRLTTSTVVNSLLLLDAPGVHGDITRPLILTLFGFLKFFQNDKTSHSRGLFTQFYFCLPLYLPPSTVYHRIAFGRYGVHQVYLYHFKRLLGSLHPGDMEILIVARFYFVFCR